MRRTILDCRNCGKVVELTSEAYDLLIAEAERRSEMSLILADKLKLCGCKNPNLYYRVNEADIWIDGTEMERRIKELGEQ